MRVSPRSLSDHGFTLIEIVMVLVLLGILTAVAVPKYFDLQNEARQKAALTAIAEAQSRINATFSQKLLEGASCSDAVAFINKHFADLGDTAGKFGDFELQLQGALLATGAATPVKVKMNDEYVGEGALGALVVARCSVATTGNGTYPSTLEAFYALGSTYGSIIASYQQANSTPNKKDKLGETLMKELLENLGAPFIDNPVEYWRVVNTPASQQSNIFLTSTDLSNMRDDGISAMRVPFMQMQQTAGGQVRYFVGMVGVAQLDNGKGAMLINDRTLYAGTVWNKNYGGVDNKYGGPENGGYYLVRDANGSWTDQLSQPEGMSHDEAMQAYQELLTRYPGGKDLIK